MSKKIFYLLLIDALIIALSFNVSSFQNEASLRDFKIGDFSYHISKEVSYSHDDDWNAVFFVVYRANHRKNQCSAYFEAKRNDSTFIKGSYSIYKDRIEFYQYYYFSKNRVSLDSMKTIFYPNRKGNLDLRELIEFKNGKADTTKYKSGI